MEKNEKGSKGKKPARHKTLEEKLKKYEFNAVGYEFIPLMMHNIRRYLQHEKEIKSYFGARMERLTKEDSAHTEFLSKVLKIHDAINLKITSRIFSNKFADKDLGAEFPSKDLKAILDRSVLLNDKPLSVLVNPDFGIKKDCCCGDDKDPAPPKDPKNRYEINFHHLYCVDESDPEYFGDDEIYVVFGMITEEMVINGNAAVAVHTPEYEDIEDGSRRPKTGSQGLRLYGFAGPSTIASNLLITGTCFEHDLGDITSTTSSIRSALTTAATTAAGAGGTVGWILAGAAAIAIGVSYLVDLFGEDDQIGKSLQKTFTQQDCDNLTNSANPRILSAMHFDGGDDDGIDDVYLELRRV